MHSDRIRRESLLDKVVSPEEAARFIKNGMNIGMSGFIQAGEAKAVPLALAERTAHQELKITLISPGFRAGAFHPWHFDLLAHDEGRLAKLIYAGRNES